LLSYLRRPYASTKASCCSASVKSSSPRSAAKLGQARQRRHILDPLGIEQDEARRPRLCVPARGRRELAADPGDGRLDLAQILVLALERQIAVPARLDVDASDDGAHEGEKARAGFPGRSRASTGAHRKIPASCAMLPRSPTAKIRVERDLPAALRFRAA
jgi:hypothetical protein